MDCEDCTHFYDEPSCDLKVDADTCPLFSEASFKLTEKGEGMAINIIGGQDVANMASALAKLLVQYGNAIGGKVEDGIGTWLMMVQVARLWKEYGQLGWENLIKKLEDEVLEPTGYFKDKARAFGYDLKGLKSE